MELLECVLLHLNLIVTLKNNNNNHQPRLVSNFASCVAILEIPFKKNQAERNKHFADRSWLL